MISGTASAPILLVVGETVITTTVTAANGVKTKSYTVLVIRASLAAIPDLEISPGVLTPAFISTTLGYTAQVGFTDASTLVTVTASPGDVISVTVAANGGHRSRSGVPGDHPLAVGENVITVTVTAADATTQSYTPSPWHGPAMRRCSGWRSTPAC